MFNLNLDKEFLGKRIIVTGASRGLGSMACRALVEREAKIAMLSRSKKERIQVLKHTKYTGDYKFNTARSLNLIEKKN